MAEQKWAGTTFGNSWMHKWLVRILRIIDLRILYVFVALFIVPFCLLFNKSGRTTYRYFRRRIGYGSLMSFWHTYVNHVMFGQVVIDKFAMYAGKQFTVETDGYDYYLELANKSEGFIQLSSHIGNYEIAGYTLVADTKRFNALVFWGEKESVMKNRKKMFDLTNINMIPVKPDMTHLFEIDRAMSDGEIVSMPADRIFGSNKKIRIEFLGSEADFPAGPFSVATLRGSKVIAVNVMKDKWNAYHVYITPLDYYISKNRKEQIQELSLSYVHELERMLRMYPNQWYNYFDFWKA